MPLLLPEKNSVPKRVTYSSRNGQRKPLKTDSVIEPDSWSSKKIDRAVSALAAETYALSNAIARMEWIRLLWHC